MADDQYSIEFNQEEIAKLKRISECLRATAGQNEEYNALAMWLADVCNNDDSGDEETPGKPKRKKKK